MNPPDSNRPLHVLHVILALTPTNCQYNEHCLPMLSRRDITICTYFRSKITPPAGITLFDGNSTVTGFFRAARAALRAGEYDVIHVHTPHAGILMLIALLMTGLFRKCMPITVHTVHNSFQNYKWRNKLMFVPSFIAYRKLVFCSHASYVSFPALLKWLGGNRLHVVQNAVDLDRIDRITNREQTRPAEQFTVATVGLIPLKNPFTVLEAFCQADDQQSRLFVLGDGPLRPKLAQAIETAGLHNQVTLTGLVERDRVFAYFKQADVFISASWGEGLPVAVMEAMACGRPVILSDIPPHREIAEGADWIPLVRPDDAGGFARELKRLSAMSAAERARIGQQCRALIEERFSLPAMHAGYETVYAQITGQQALALGETVT